MNEKNIYFARPDIDTWALARIHHSLLLQIQDSPLWEKEKVPDIPLTEGQMVSFVKGYCPDWECRYVPYLLGGWFYITRSGWWLKKLKYQKGTDGFYHVIDHYTTEHEKGRNLLATVLLEGYFGDSFRDERLLSILKTIDIY